ncbi:DUF1735 and LamG domain-containing protein [Halosquirtibacter laminarini]|uniref:DUF1735 and LamG domain-containing protein n=1 Tax=Halosquirtibacter laminarini TaxID=3374600 RepID=A0AC61NGA4_9BACT|nr:DUF1735 and LamG domain-containing protein [Prolixibacteraceae bacterium]
MRNIYIILTTCVFGLLFITGCSDDQYTEIENGIYISQSESNMTEKVVVADKGADYLLSLRLGNLHNSDVVASLEVNDDIIDQYNKENGTKLIALPESFFTLSEKEVVIQKGEINSSPIKIHINALDETLPEGNKYAIPVAIKESNGVSMVNASRSRILIIQRVMITNVAHFNASPTSFEIPTPLDLTAWTVEFRIKMDSFHKNNQAVFWSGPTEIYSRFGDVVIDKNQLQVKGVNAQVNTQTHFTPNQWYHMAMVFDGATFKIYIDGEVDLNVGAEVGKVYNMKSFGFGNFKGQFSEMRFFQTARTQSEIKDNMYALDPQTPGLIGYYRLNEGSGDVLKDSSSNGYNIDIPSGVTWVNNVKVPDIQ